MALNMSTKENYSFDLQLLAVSGLVLISLNESNKTIKQLRPLSASGYARQKQALAQTMGEDPEQMKRALDEKRQMATSRLLCVRIGDAPI